MPFYQIEYICDLSDQEQDKLAEAITKIHSEKFTAPRMFVNVVFQPATTNSYVAGKRHKSNRITGSLRAGPSRTKADYDDVGEQIAKAWEEIVGSGGDRELGAVFLLNAVISARERGFLVPVAGEEPAWVKENFGKFQELADGGNELFKDMMEDLKAREAFKGSVPAGY